MPLAKAQPPSFGENTAVVDPQTADSTDGLREAKSDRSSGETFVRLAGPLRHLMLGEVPQSLDELRKMEKQQQQVATAAAACTVSVQIGNSQGCGVIITGDGYVLTAAHVAMRRGLDAVLTLSDGSQVRGKTLGLNREVDAGLIKIVSPLRDAQPWPHASLGTSKDLEVGMWVIATGHPGGYLGDRGVVARVGRILAVRSGAIVTDCALIGGDSGGPLFDLEGKLVGVHSRIGNDVADNLHVPVDHYDQSWNRLVKSEAWGFLPGFRPVIGVRGKDDGDNAEIVDVIPNSPAERAGIVAGDIIQSFGSVPISDFQSLKAAVSETMPGELILVRLRRGETTLRVNLEIGRDPDS